uniref:Sugar transporter n=1 Tax=Nilaparvata lugens TaxID=108931 RepID=A0A0A8J8I6_NILLU|nr:sugar transporter [Nilaparvata lugens]
MVPLMEKLTCDLLDPLKKLKKKNVSFSLPADVGAATVLAQSVTLGMIAGWPTVSVPLLLAGHGPVSTTPDQVSWLTTLHFLGNLLSPVPAGFLMDHWGRRTTLTVASILPVVAWPVVALCDTTTQLVVAWFVVGMWSGVVYTVVPVYLGEIAKPQQRGLLGTLFSAARRLGAATEFVLGQVLTYRQLALISALPAILSALLLLRAPESPYYLLRRRRDRQAAGEALKQLRPMHESHDLERELDDIERFVNERTKGGYRSLIATGTGRRALFVMEALAVLQRLSDTGAVMGYIAASLPPRPLPFLEKQHAVMGLEAAKLFTGLISTLVIDLFTRKSLMLTASLACTAAMFWSGTWYLLVPTGTYNLHSTNYDLRTGTAWMPYGCLALHQAGYSLGLSPVFWSLRSELFPMAVKAQSSAITTTTLALVACVVNRMFFIIAQEFGIYLNYYIFCISCLLNALVTVFFVVETGGKTLSQIQDDLDEAPSKDNDASADTRTQIPAV